MNEKIKRICEDPLFQLNLTIWLAQPMPDNFSIRPLFYQSGFKIYSIGLLLPLPPDIKLITETSNLKVQGSVKPEIILECENTTKLLIVECKKSSFGKTSSTANQARTLLILSGSTIFDVLGMDTSKTLKGYLCYFTMAEQTGLLENTLSQLAEEIKLQINLKTGGYGCFGINPENNSIQLEFSEQLMSDLGIIQSSPVEVLNVVDGTIPRPLYFIPYDSGVDQTPEEQAFCRRILYERFLGFILCKIGPAAIPGNVIITWDEVIKEVTMGLYEVWDDRDVKKHMKSLWHEFMRALKASFKENLRNYLNHELNVGWCFKFQNKDEHEELVSQVCKFKPEEMDLSKTQLELFEELN